MIKRKEEMTSRIVESVRGGNGNTVFLDFLTEEESLGKLRIAALTTLEKGCSIGRHPHGPDAEIYIITKGKAIVDDDGVETTLEAGDVIYTGGGAFHAIRNEEDEALQFIAIVIN